MTDWWVNAWWKHITISGERELIQRRQWHDNWNYIKFTRSLPNYIEMAALFEKLRTSRIDDWFVMNTSIWLLHVRLVPRVSVMWRSIKHKTSPIKGRLLRKRLVKVKGCFVPLQADTMTPMVWPSRIHRDHTISPELRLNGCSLWEIENGRFSGAICACTLNATLGNMLRCVNNVAYWWIWLQDRQEMRACSSLNSRKLSRQNQWASCFHLKIVCHNSCVSVKTWNQPIKATCQHRTSLINFFCN